MHSDEELLKVSKVLAQKVLDLKRMCEDVSVDEELRCHYLDDLAALAGQVCCDTGQYNPDTEDKTFK